MTLSLACADAGLDCSFVAKGETKEELFGKAAKHGKKVHGYTDAQLSDPEMVRQMEEIIKEN